MDGPGLDGRPPTPAAGPGAPGPGAPGAPDRAPGGPTRVPEGLQPAPRLELPTWEPSGAGGPTRAWVAQALTGVGLLALVTVHMIANHFVVPKGLRDFAAVVDYLSSPLIVAIEVTFLVLVSWHGLLGVRAILFDFGFSPATERRISRGLFALGVATVAYGLWLTSVIVSYR
jgi:succinate dehydrogenase hydrophobic anchor subunit